MICIIVGYSLREVLKIIPSEAAPAAAATTAQTASVSAESVQPDISKVKIEPLFEEFVDFDTFAKSDFRVVKIEACEAVPKSKKLLKFSLNDGTDKKRTILSGIHEYYEPEQLVGKTCVATTIFLQYKKFELGKFTFNFSRETYSIPEKLVKFFNVTKTTDNTMNFLKNVDGLYDFYTESDKSLGGSINALKNATGIGKNSKVFSIFDKYGTKAVKTIEDVVGLIGG